MTFSDIFKSSFLESVTEFSVIDTLIGMLFAVVIGAGMIPLAVIGSAIIGLILVVFANQKTNETPYILIVNCADEKAEESALDIIGKSTEKHIVKAKTVNDAGIELTAEVRLKDAATSFVNRINEISGVSGATLVTFNGEYMS
ncbi:MAG: hypothetical protein ABS874_07150 [Lachnospiraceae bacterium]